MTRQVDVAYAHQPAPEGRTKPWGTGHALVAAEPEVDGPFAVVNADDFYGPSAFVRLARFLRATPPNGAVAAAIVGFQVGQTVPDVGAVSRALCQLGPDGRLSEIVELLEVWREDGYVTYRDEQGDELRLEDDEIVSMNMWGFSHGLFPQLRAQFEAFLAVSRSSAEAEFLLPDAIRQMLREGTIRVSILQGTNQWCGLTFKAEHGGVRSSIASHVSRGQYPERLWTR